MKKNKAMGKSFIYKILILCGIVLLGCSYDCKINKPKGVKPIDRENYNDAYTIYWNCVKLCEEYSEHEGTIIKISGWKAWSYDLFYLCDDPKYAIFELGYMAAFPIVGIRCDLPEFYAKLDTCDLTKKCFVKGKLVFASIEEKCCEAVPEILVTDIDDIYFE